MIEEGGKVEKWKGDKVEKPENRKVRSFEDLHVYQQARELTSDVYALSRLSAFAKDYGLVDQTRRAAVSIMSNIAEGFERGTKKEFIQFLYVAKGSCGELRAQLAVAWDQKYVSGKDHEQLTNKCRLISGMLGNLIARLRESPAKGPKFSEPRRQSEKATE
jgi:four helix bundle protein